MGIFAGVFCLLIAASAAAAEAKPCADDAARLCKGVQSGEGRMAKCLNEHEKELSSACKAKIAEFKEKVNEFAEACKADVEKDCKGVQPGEGRIVQCLRQHEATLSPACKEKMREANAAQPCADDAARLCKGVEPGEGRVAKCLKEHEKELTPACKAKVSEFEDKVRDLAEACKADAEKECKGVQPGGGRIVQCLKQHEATLSPACREKMSQGKGRK